MDNIENEANGGVETGKTFTQDEVNSMTSAITTPSCEKTFTQDEVNHIIRKRLDEERRKTQKEQDAVFADREKDLKSREMRMFAREQLKEKGLPDNFVDAMNCSDEETIQKSIEILEKAYTDNSQKLRGVKMHSVAPARSIKPNSADQTIRDAMGL